jgi:hypothetical protein
MKPAIMPNSPNFDHFYDKSHDAVFAVCLYCGAEMFHGQESERDAHRGDCEYFQDYSVTPPAVRH